MRKQNLFVIVLVALLFTISVFGIGSASAASNTKVEIGSHIPGVELTYGFVNYSQNKDGDLRLVIKVKNGRPNTDYRVDLHLAEGVVVDSYPVTTDSEGTGSTGAVWTSGSTLSDAAADAGLEPGAYDMHLCFTGPGPDPDNPYQFATTPTVIVP